LLRLASARTISGSAETYLVSIKTLAMEHAARCMVIDPMSTWSRSGNGANTHSVAERLTDWAKANGITLVCTSQFEAIGIESGSSALQIPTLADTWIQLSYLIQAGERNRGLSIIKSRGTAHSNQVRELVLSDRGVTLTDTYTASGEVLMGTLRWQKEGAERAERDVKEVAAELRRVKLEAEEAELEVRVKLLQVELEAKQVEKALMIQTVKSRAGELTRGRTRIEQLRGADLPVQGRK
jgi:circadian clock protein KaiC